MPDIKDIKDVKEASGIALDKLLKETPGLAFDKILETYKNAFKPPQPLLPLDLGKMHFTSLVDVVANLKALKATVIEGSRQANRLNKVIVKLTWALVALTAAAVILTAISLYVLFSSAK